MEEVNNTWLRQENKVCHCCRNDEEIIKIINARKTTSNEKKQYVARNDIKMKEEYDFTKAIKNPYVKKLKNETINTGVPYQTL